MKIEQSDETSFKRALGILSEKDKKKIQDRIVAMLKEGETLVKFEEFKGQVGITNFEYEAFSVGVKIQRKPLDQKQELNTCSVTETKEVMKEYLIPEGFTVWLEITFKHKQRPTTMF